MSSGAAKRDGEYQIAASLVHSVVAGLILMAFGSSGAAIWATFEIRSGLAKLDSLPDGQVIAERRERQQEINTFQDGRIDRLERAVFSTGEVGSNDTMPALYLPGAPGPAPGCYVTPRYALKKDRESLQTDGGV